MNDPISADDYSVNRDDLGSGGFDVDLDALEHFNSKMQELLNVLGQVENALEKRSLTALPGFANRTTDQDISELPLGDFEDAKEVAQRYHDRVFSQRREQIGRIRWGVDTCGRVALDDRDRYADADRESADEQQRVMREIDELQLAKSKRNEPVVEE